MIRVPRYEDMTKAELIECLKAHDAHHQEHHTLEENISEIARAAISWKEHKDFPRVYVALEKIWNKLQVAERRNKVT